MHTPAPLTTRETTDGQGYPEIVIQAGTEILATVHHLGNDREEEWRELARTMAAAPKTRKFLETLHRWAFQNEHDKNLGPDYSRAFADMRGFIHNSGILTGEV